MTPTSLLVDLSSGNVIDLVDGRDLKAVSTWLEQPKWWRRRVEVVAIDPSAAFRSAVRRLLPKARVSVDHFHLVKVRHEAPCVRMEVRDLHRLVVAAAGLKLRAA